LYYRFSSSRSGILSSKKGHKMQQSQQRTKYIFVTGGVVSSLGKGIVGASIGALLETRGLRVIITKADPYINVDPGTMNPFQHGEVFVTDDGAETDLDLGHYERFITAKLSRLNSFSSGQVYDAVIGKERRGDYLGGTVQVVPHVTNQIKENIFRSSQGYDIAIIEIGGTVGDIEGQPYLEAIRQIRYEFGSENVICVHLTLVPYIQAAKELKTKPTQHSVKELRQYGIQPDIICCRADRPIPSEVLRKIALTCNVRDGAVIEVCDVDSIYKVPLLLHRQGLDQVIVDTLNIWTGAPNLVEWQRICQILDNPKQVCRIGIVGKYVDVADSYKSINEALIHAGIANHARVEIELIDAEKVSKGEVKEFLSRVDGVVVPGGFGNRGIEGKINTIRYLRESGKPFLGICLGMQLAAVEFARNELGISDATSHEFEPDAENRIIHLMESQKAVSVKGGTMRLGAYPCRVAPNSKASKAYNSDTISERHRHRFEFNNAYRSQFEEKGVFFSGLSPDETLVEIMELRDHPWYVGVQFHPELKSSPMNCHALFRDFVEASLKAVQHSDGGVQ
jgi:CTP synthase